MHEAGLAPEAEAAGEFFLLPDHAGLRFGRIIAALHRHMKPQSYLEIGTLSGGTLRIATCPSIAVDVRFMLDEDVLGSKPACLLMQMPSDRFFANYDPSALLNRPIDLAFLDGMHLFEFLLRDFINTERHCRPESIILLHDCLPTDAYVARRELADRRFEHLSPHPDWWAGDVWKTVAILKKYRPDLRILAFNSRPTGLVAVTDLDPGSDVLARQYFSLTEQFRSVCLTQRGAEAFMATLNVAASDICEEADALAAIFGPAQPASFGRNTNPGRREALSREEPRRKELSEGPMAVHAVEKVDAPVAGLEDIWSRLRPLLLHWRQLAADEAAVRAQQFGMVRDGCFLMPSPFDDQPDLCSLSWYVAHRFCYHFWSVEEYFWISSSSDDAFVLSTIYFPERRIALGLGAHAVNEQFLLDLERLRSIETKPAAAPEHFEGRRVVVTDHSHYMHTLWNELPALDKAVSSGLAKRLLVAALYQPLGPLAELFPELEQDLRVLKFGEISALNREHRLLVGLGSRTITRRVQERVRDVAARHVLSEIVERRDRFRRAHAPIFWFSVKPPGRTCVREAEVLAHLVTTSKRAYPSAGFILDGTSRPWDLETNDNYGSWFMPGLQSASAYARQTIADVIARLPRKLHSCVQAVSDVPVCEEIVWGEAADFYFCHGGTMQNKIGWIHRVPGMIHTSNEFMGVWKALSGVVEDAPPVYFVSSEIIVDGEPRSYPAFTRERVQANYDFTSLDDLAAEFLGAARASLPAAASPSAPRPPAGNRRKKQDSAPA